MIRIDRPAEIPKILATRGKTQTEKLCRDYDTAPAAYDSRERRFVFNEKLYGDRTVKEALVSAQHGKCCFCESKTGMDGDVEHFRPKAGFSQGTGAPIEGPGYYWLAYEWDNLLLACSICNQRFKRNHFPLADATKRARSHRSDVSQEDPLFINPCERDPEELISFRREIPYAIDGNHYAMSTIEALGLNREILNERRRDRLEMLKALYTVVMSADRIPKDEQQMVNEARRILAHATSADAEFAAMARAAARSGFYVNN